MDTDFQQWANPTSRFDAALEKNLHYGRQAALHSQSYLKKTKKTWLSTPPLTLL